VTVRTTRLNVVGTAVTVASKRAGMQIAMVGTRESSTLTAQTVALVIGKRTRMTQIAAIIVEMVSIAKTRHFPHNG